MTDKEDELNLLQEFIIDGYNLYTTTNHKGDEIMMLRFPSGEGMGISKEKLIEFFEKCYDEDF